MNAAQPEKCTYATLPAYFGTEWVVRYGTGSVEATHTGTGLMCQFQVRGEKRPSLVPEFNIEVAVPAHLFGGRFGLPLREHVQASHRFVPGSEPQERLRRLRAEPEVVTWLLTEAAYRGHAEYEASR